MIKQHVFSVLMARMAHQHFGTEFSQRELEDATQRLASLWPIDPVTAAAVELRAANAAWRSEPTASNAGRRDRAMRALEALSGELTATSRRRAS